MLLGYGGLSCDVAAFALLCSTADYYDDNEPIRLFFRYEGELAAIWL